MSDLISRQDAIDTIEAKEANEFGNYLEYNVAFNDGLRSAVYAIEDLPSAQQWIPCSERFPEYNVSVLTWDGYAFCIEKRIPYICDDDGFPIEGDYWVGDEYDDLESDCYPNLRDGAAIAWMPLPEPYSGADMRKGEADD